LVRSAPPNDEALTIRNGRAVAVEEEGAPADSDEDKKRRNRAAAQRCRLKKKKQVQELESRSTHLIRENTDLRNAQQKLLYVHV
jgi:hypothetical protein